MTSTHHLPSSRFDSSFDVVPGPLGAYTVTPDDVTVRGFAVLSRRIDCLPDVDPEPEPAPIVDLPVEGRPARRLRAVSTLTVVPHADPSPRPQRLVLVGGPGRVYDQDADTGGPAPEARPRGRHFARLLPTLTADGQVADDFALAHGPLVFTIRPDAYIAR